MIIKNITTRTICTAVIAIACLCCNPVAADLVLAFSADNGISFSNRFDVATGDNLTISIYAQQTGDNDELTDPAKGLASFGFDLASNDDGLGIISSRTVNPFYDLPNRDATTATGFEWEYFRADTTSLKGVSIWLGTFQYDTIADGMTLFSIEDRLPGSGLSNASWLTPGLEALDEEFFGSGAADTFQFSVNATAVPEPGSFVLFGLFGLATGLQRRRRIV